MALRKPICFVFSLAVLVGPMAGESLVGSPLSASQSPGSQDASTFEMNTVHGSSFTESSTRLSEGI